MVGLGREEEHAVDARPAEERGEKPRAAEAEALEDGAERAPRILEGVLPGIQRAQHVDQHHLPVEAAEMLAVEGGDDLLAILVVTLRHERVECAGPRRRIADRQRAEP
jgi:hypothetical protein